MEVTDHLELTLKEIFARYPYRMEVPVRDGFRICLLSRHTLHNETITHYGATNTPLLNATIEIDGKPYSIYSAHPKPALSREWNEERHIYFKEVEKVIGADENAKIMMGDFNSVPWEPHFQRFLQNSGLRSTLKKHGYKVTWPVYCIPMGIPMDHILVSNDVICDSLKIGPSCGSDHYPVSMNLK
jgi:endonuclease/exonuclease/phosphatase (EEP) superfamily protein YafD